MTQALSKTPHLFLYVLAVSGLLIASCSPTRKLAENEYLLKKNEVRVAKEGTNIDKSELEGYIRQKPNRKILGVFRFHLQAYNLGKSMSETKFSNWLMNTVGEQPVIVDKQLAASTERQFEIYLANKGYFNATVTDTIVYVRKKKIKRTLKRWFGSKDTTSYARKQKAIVQYTVHPGEPYKIRNVSYSIKDKKLEELITKRITNGTFVKSGMQYDSDAMQKERARVTDRLKNSGYFYFAKEYIYYEADSAVGDKQVDVTMVVKNVPVKTASGDTISDKPHEIYYVDNIYINTEYSTRLKDTIQQDTLHYKNVVFTHNGKMKYKPETILGAVFFSKEEQDTLIRFAERYRERTYQYLSGLRAFRYINMEFKETGVQDGKNTLDCYIQLSPSPKQAFAFETKGTYTSGNPGVSGVLTFQNKNAFRGAERLEILLSGGLEIQQLLDESADNNIIENVPFNTIEVSPEIKLTVPRLLTPFFKIKGLPKVFNKETHFSLSYNFQQRPDFTRSIITASYGYDGQLSRISRLIFNPVEINAVNVYNQAASFSDKLDALNNQLLKRSFEPHITTVTNATYIYSDQSIRKNENFTYVRLKGELSGNILRGIYNMVGAEQDTFGSYTIGGIPFAQYWKVEADYRRYWVMNPRSMVVGRIMVGTAFPLDNLKVLPFESSFIAGGASDVRAWRNRELGPGGLDSDIKQDLDQFGDAKLEMNLEYRFDIYKWVKGAFFADAGNIWLVKEDLNRPDTHFELNRFYKELGVGTGFGLRLDFNFFVIRSDFAIKVYDPSQPEYDPENPQDGNQRWRVPKWQFQQLIVNLGIGYPF